MVKVYVYMGKDRYVMRKGHASQEFRGNWTRADDKILPYFENPGCNGEYYIYEGDGSIGDITEPDPLKIGGAIHIASNFGWSDYGIVPKTTNIVNPKRTEGYILYQGHICTAKISGNVESLVKLNPDSPRQSNTRTVCLVGGSFEDILKEFTDYEIFEANDAESLAALEERYGLEGFR